ncbi:sensor histidine kinase [Thomasclavelia sp.]
MKFFWKLYLTIMLTVVTCFSVGGYLLIETGFKSSLEREIEMAYQENDILFSSFVNDIFTPIDGYVNTAYSNDERFSIIQSSATTLRVQTFNGSISFCLREKNGKMIYQNGGFFDDSSLIEKIKSGTRGYKIVQNDNKYKIHTLRRLDLGINDIDIYLENSRDISSLFKGRKDQYQTFMYCIGLLSLIGAVVIFIVTRWLVKPIKKLSQATKQITAEGLGNEIVVTSNDEIGQLTKDFNTMTKRLMISMDKLQESFNRQEIFVSNFAHELKTPLTSMIGYGDMLRSKKLSEEQIISFANLIVQEGKRLEVMSMKLMELIVLKRQDFEMAEINITDFFDGVTAVVAPIMRDSGIDFKISVEDDIVLMEADLMKTVCLNLLDNARKAIIDNGVIEFFGIKDNEGYRIVIKDNGCGIDAKEIDKIKEAFYMVDKSRSRSAGGAGLGLAICDQVIKLHHGRMIIESIKDQGTIVTVLLKGGETSEKN